MIVDIPYYSFLSAYQFLLIKVYVLWRQSTQIQTTAKGKDFQLMAR